MYPIYVSHGNSLIRTFLGLETGNFGVLVIAVDVLTLLFLQHVPNVFSVRLQSQHEVETQWRAAGLTQRGRVRERR